MIGSGFVGAGYNSGMADDSKAGPNEEELEELEDEIQHARGEADEALHGSFYEGDDPMFVDSGDARTHGSRVTNR